MNASMMLKDEAGRIVGYLLLKEKTVLVRVKGRGETGMLALLSQDKTVKEVSIICDGHEHEAVYEGAPPELAYVAAENALLCASGERARAAYAKRSSDACERKENETGTNGIGERVPQAQACLKTQSRWPPPPCFQHARYQDGSWSEVEEEIAPEPPENCTRLDARV